MSSKIACLLGDGFEDSEFQKPLEALKQAGHVVSVIGAEKGKKLKGKGGQVEASVEQSIDEVEPGQFDALFIPGGYSPDHLRVNPSFVQFTKAFDSLARPLFAICHGPQLMMSAGIVGKGRTLTAWSTVQGDLRYTGATVKDEPVVSDGNWVTSRKPDDLPKFCQEIIRVLQRPHAGGVAVGA